MLSCPWRNVQSTHQRHQAQPMRGTDHARPRRIPRAHPKPSRHATPNAHPQTARAQHPAAHRTTTGKSYGDPLPREAPCTSSQRGSHPKQHHDQAPEEHGRPDTNKREQHRTQTRPATTSRQTTRSPMSRYSLQKFLSEPPRLFNERNCSFNNHSVC